MVVLLPKDDKNARPVAAKVSSALKSAIETAGQDGSFSGDKKETCFFRGRETDGFAHVLLVGLGPVASLTPESFRVAASVAVSQLKSQKVTSAAINADVITTRRKDAMPCLQALIEGLELSTYEYVELKAKPKDDAAKKQLTEVTVFLTGGIDQAMTKVVERAQILADAQNLARRLGDTPANYMTPTKLAEEAMAAAKGTSLKVTAWDKARIKKERFGGLIAVNQGSTEEPRFIIMEHNGGPKSQAPVVFVGKGVTFDTGGISIKPSASMEEMKYDMCGAGAVIGTMVALAKLKAKINVIGLVPSTDNMPGPAALKPGDVYTARNGKTVEVFNTDAEGRLILGDALAYGAEMKPRAMFDAATLTGAILISLGNTHTGVFTRDRDLMKRIQGASDATGEWVWPMPLVDFHVEDMKGTHADLCNISNGRLAGSSTAAAFLEEMVGKDIPWAHFDIAGTAWNIASRFPYHPRKGASGIMVRTFVQIAESFLGK
jgi:leucyl aminopeptidase